MMLLAPTPQVSPVYRTVTLSSGRAGVLQTLTQMRVFVNDGRISPAIRNCALRIVWNVPERDHLAEVTALFEYVRDSIRYVRDVNNVETVSSADNTLAILQGDCDDQTVLLCALLESVGYPTRFVVAGYHDQNCFEHVFCQVFFDGQWVNGDATEKQPLGYMPPDPVCIAFEKV